MWLLIPSPGLPAPSPPIDSYTVATDTVPSADLYDAPVYYERNLDRYTRKGDLELLRAGKVRVQHYDPVDVTNFAWSKAGTEYTWWMQMEEMRFLLPLISSSRRSDHELAKQWLARWYTVHVSAGVKPHLWGEPMTFAYRAMVFVYYLKTEERRESPDAEIVEMLRTSIRKHQEHLIPDHNFDRDNNHGMIDALGLLETTRVFPHRGARALALERIATMVSNSVSDAGVELEHAAVYHFIFLRWLDEILEYTRDLPGAPSDFVARMESVSAAMHGAAYFMHDHRGWIAPIGDTDSVSVDYYSRELRKKRAPNGARALHDPKSGYAIYKGKKHRRDARYVIFRQPQRILMTAHAHGDAMALFLGYDGEVLLGDAGRYSYTPGATRSYFKSPSAHNTVLLPPPPGMASPSLPVVTAVRDVSTPDTTIWTADLTLGPLLASRVVRIPIGARDVVVNDAIFDTDADSTAGQRVTVQWHIGKDVRSLEETRNGENGVWEWKLTTRRGKHARLQMEVHGDSTATDPELTIVHGEKEPML
ncbi:MAG TPA: heparinase II/III family protein, partial [Candidatus Krumholzibacteria bacterium]|nr:heparinase II/III family protein [Candidatus Krumholzibacteria bacterium]